MLLVPTTVGQSPIHGLGLFAAEAIPAGTVIWQLDPLFDRVFTVEELTGRPPLVREFIEHYCEYFPETGELVLSCDGDRYTNHSDDPNTRVDGENRPDARVIATRDIAAGEEITCDYGEIRSLKWSVMATTAA